MANVFGQFLKPSQEQQIADSYIQEIGRGDRTAGDRFGQYLGAQEAAQASDPFAQRYEDIGESQTEGLIFDQPEQERMREDALMRKLAPIRVGGEYDLAKQRIASEGQMGAAQVGAQRAQQTQAAQMQRTQATQQGQDRRAGNARLEAQAKTAQTSGESAYNPMRWLMGRPTGEEQAATLRGQMQTEAPQQGGGGADTAQQLFTEFSTASPEQVAEYAQQELGISDPAAIQELVAAYQMLQRQ